MFAKENIRIISAFIFIVVLLLPIIIVGTCYDIKQTDNLPKIISFINQTLPIDLTYNENNNINDKFHRVEFRVPFINYEKDIVISYASEKENLIYLSATRLPLLSLKDFRFHYFKNGRPQIFSLGEKNNSLFFHISPYYLIFYLQMFTFFLLIFFPILKFKNSNFLIMAWSFTATVLLNVICAYVNLNIEKYVFPIILIVLLYILHYKFNNISFKSDANR